MCSLSLASPRGDTLQPQPTAVYIFNFLPLVCSFFVLPLQICCLFCFLCLCLGSSCPSGKMSAWMSFSIRLSAACWCSCLSTTESSSWCSCFSTTESSSNLFPTVQAPKYLLSIEKDDTEAPAPGSLYHHCGQRIYILYLNSLYLYLFHILLFSQQSNFDENFNINCIRFFFDMWE